MANNKKERRGAIQSSREEMEASLSEIQKLTLERIEAHGWQLQFVRIHSDRSVVPVVYDAKSSQLAVIEPDGHLNTRPGLKFRSH